MIEGVFERVFGGGRMPKVAARPRGQNRWLGDGPLFRALCSVPEKGVGLGAHRQAGGLEAHAAGMTRRRRSSSIRFGTIRGRPNEGRGSSCERITPRHGRIAATSHRHAAAGRGIDHPERRTNVRPPTRVAAREAAHPIGSRAFQDLSCTRKGSLHSNSVEVRCSRRMIQSTWPRSPVTAA